MYYRWMSFKEFNKMSAGCDIVGRQYHNARTSSRGVCFLPERTIFMASDGKAYGYAPQETERFLSGIVTRDVLVGFQENVTLTPAVATYADPENTWDYYARISIVEYNLPHYNRDMMVPVTYYIPGRFVDDPGEWYVFN